MTSYNSGDLHLTFRGVLDARSQFVAFACGALFVPRLSLLGERAAAIKVLLDACQIGQRWVVRRARRIGLVICGAEAQLLQTLDFCPELFVGVSHTLGVVWHRVHLLSGAGSRTAGLWGHCGTDVGCYLGCGNWISPDSHTVAAPIFLMNEGNGRFTRRARMLENIPTYNMKRQFQSNGKWLVCTAGSVRTDWPCMRVWRIIDGVPDSHCVALDLKGYLLFKVRFQTWSHDADHVIVLASVSPSGWHVLSVDLEASFSSGVLVHTRKDIVPSPSGVSFLSGDIMQFQPEGFLTLHFQIVKREPKATVLYNTLTGESVVFPHSDYSDIMLVQPSYVVAERDGEDAYYQYIYTASNLRAPLRVCHHSKERRVLPSFGLVETRGERRLDYHDIITGAVLFSLETTKNDLLGQSLSTHVTRHHTSTSRVVHTLCDSSVLPSKAKYTPKLKTRAYL
ncbi:hypothetical protein Pelo_14544 [Pelomyxa schiedti]|nr:hypothetical protein Pelo_14544 [Pelomyxa schiedti]